MESTLTWRMTMTALKHATARDLMEREVLTLNSATPVKEAIETFEEYRISGAPVVDTGGRLVGVLSAFDIARSEHIDGDRLSTERHDYYLSNPLGDEREEAPCDDEEFYGKEDYSQALLGRETVGDWMTPKIISVSPDTPIRDVCDRMVVEGIHRVLVREQGALVGIISSFDVVKYLAAKL
jgi:CBS domain-containing protein